MEEATNKCEAAVALGKLRWAKKSDSERREHCRMMGNRSALVRKVRKEDETLKIVVQ